MWCQTSCLSLLLSDNKTNLHDDDVKDDAAGKESFLLLLLGLFEQVNRLDLINFQIKATYISYINLQSMPKMGGDDDKEKKEDSPEGKAEKEAAVSILTSLASSSYLS